MLDLRNAVFAVSRSLVICALRLGLIGRGGGGTLGESRPIKARCRMFSCWSSALMASIWEGVWPSVLGREMLLVVGSR